MPVTVNIGDRFHRPSEPRLVYRVLRLIEFKNHPPHVTLVSEANGRVMTPGAGSSKTPGSGYRQGRMPGENLLLPVCAFVQKRAACANAQRGALRIPLPSSLERNAKQMPASKVDVGHDLDSAQREVMCRKVKSGKINQPSFLPEPVMAPSSPASSPSILKLRVTLLYTKPPIWRRLLVYETMTLAALHEAIHAAMGWTGSHLHEFVIDGKRYSDPQMFDEAMDQSRYRLSRLVKDGVRKFTYAYDMGDDWAHSVLVEGREPAVEEVLYPACVAGKRACPPEDCGGVWGYQEHLEILPTPDHPERAERLEYIGHEIDPEVFSVEAANNALRARFTDSGKRRPQGGRWVLKET